MTAKLLSPDDVSQLVGCAITDLRNWRRLPPEHPRCLASVKVDGKHQYEVATVEAWLERPENKLYAEHVIAAFVPDEIRMSLPHAMVRTLRGESATDSIAGGKAAPRHITVEQLHPDQPQG